MGADTLKSDALLRRAVALCCRVPLGLHGGLLLHLLTTLRAVGATQQQPPYKPNGATQQHDGAARRWECVSSLTALGAAGAVLTNADPMQRRDGRVGRSRRRECVPSLCRHRELT